MRARILRIGVGAVLLLAGYVVGAHSPALIHAQQRGSVPASYGRLVGADSGSLWFEGEDGTLRQVNVPQGNVVYVVTRHR